MIFGFRASKYGPQKIEGRVQNSKLMPPVAEPGVISYNMGVKTVKTEGLA
jgi:hypothetical protein